MNGQVKLSTREAARIILEHYHDKEMLDNIEYSAKLGMGEIIINWREHQTGEDHFIEDEEINDD